MHVHKKYIQTGEFETHKMWESVRPRSFFQTIIPYPAISRSGGTQVSRIKILCSLTCLESRKKVFWQGWCGLLSLQTLSNWVGVGRNVKEKPTSEAHSLQIVHDVWNNLIENTLKKLEAHIPRLIQAVINWGRSLKRLLQWKVCLKKI